jgi:hypothetical protein
MCCPTYPSLFKYPNNIFELTHYCAGDKTENEMGGACSADGEGRGVYRVLMGKPGGKRLLRKPTHRREDTINMDLQEVGCGSMDWIELA